jgi:hypothetical protein
MSETLRIREKELRSLLDSKETAAEALSTYFDIDDSSPFAPVYTLKPEVEIISEDGRGFGVGELMVTIANTISRRDRARRYQTIIEEHPERIRLVAEGDSWFQHPLVEDTIDHLFNHFAVYCVSAGGDELSNMFKENEYLPAIKEQRAKGLLLSGGGNDLMGGRFGSYLNQYTPGTDPRRFLNDEFFARLDDMAKIYQTIFEELRRQLPEVVVFIHGYDFVIPGSGEEGKWLGHPMELKGITDPEDKRALIRTIIDGFNGQMAELARQYDNVVYIDLRDTVRDDYWYDEIHPSSPGFQQVALKFIAAIDAALS